MKRIIGFILIFSVLICSLSAGFVSSATDTEENIEFSLEFSSETVIEGDTLDVTVKMKSSYESFLLGGIQFDIKYEYNGPSRSGAPLSFELLEDKMVYDERFSSDMEIGSQKYDGNYAVTSFISMPEAEFEEDEISITFPFLVKESGYQGQYSFVLEVEELYALDMEAEDPTPNLNYTVEGDDYYGWSGYPIWYGNSENVILAGERTDGIPIYVDTEITGWDEVYIEDENVAVLDETVYEGGFENGYEYAFVYVKGLSLGETELYVIAEYVDFVTDEGEDPDSDADDELIPYYYTKIFATKIYVIKPEPWYPSIESQPDKTEYYVGEKIDLTGLQFRLAYNNNDVKIVSSGFKVEEYDFSTPGEKEVDVYYTDNFHNTISLKLKFNVVNMYEADGSYIYNMSAKTSVAKFLELDYFSEDVKIYSGDTEVNDGIFKTGMKIKLYVEGELTKEYTVAVNNDLSGNGRVDIRDLAALKRIAAEVDVADELDLKVLGKAGAEEINAADLVKMQKEILGI